MAGAEALLHHFIAKTIGVRETVSMKEVLAADIPRGIKVFLHTELINTLRLEIEGSPRLRAIEASSTSAQQLVRGFLRSLAPAAVFERREFLTSLDSATDFVRNYLCRPQWTLTTFVFEGGSRILLPGLLAKLEYIADYGYFQTLIERYLREKGWTSLHVDDFKSLLERIDTGILKEHNARELANLTRPLYEFFLCGAPPGNDEIPVDIILTFYDDKKQYILKEYIERICAIRQKRTIGLAELTDIVESLYREDPATTPPAAENAPTSQDVPVRETPAPSHHHTPHTPMPTTPEDRTVAAQQPPEEPPARITISWGTRPEVPPESVQEAETEEIDFQALQAITQNPEKNALGQDLPDLHSIIDTEARERFIKKIFKKDGHYYNSIIDALNRTQTWKEASLHLKDLFEINQLDPYAKVVVEFTDAVYSRFASRSRSSA